MSGRDGVLPPELTAPFDEDYQIDPRLLRELAGRILEESHGPIRKSHLRLKQLALDIAGILDRSARTGLPVDFPEGSRLIVLSDTLARKLAAVLKAAALAKD